MQSQPHCAISQQHRYCHSRLGIPRRWQASRDRWTVLQLVAHHKLQNFVFPFFISFEACFCIHKLIDIIIYELIVFFFRLLLCELVIRILVSQNYWNSIIIFFILVNQNKSNDWSQTKNSTSCLRARFSQYWQNWQFHELLPQRTGSWSLNRDVCVQMHMVYLPFAFRYIHSGRHAVTLETKQETFINFDFIFW